MRIAPDNQHPRTYQFGNNLVPDPAVTVIEMLYTLLFHEIPYRIIFQRQLVDHSRHLPVQHDHQLGGLVHAGTVNSFKQKPNPCRIIVTHHVIRFTDHDTPTFGI